MGLLSALSEKIYHFNSINTPIDNELNKKILELENSIEKVSLIAAFYISQKMVLGMFNPDNGMFNNKIKLLTTQKLKTIWTMLIIASVEQLISTAGLESDYGITVIHNTSKILNIPTDEIVNFIKLNTNDSESENIVLVEIWDKICDTINEDPKNSVNSTAFIYAFSDLYNTQIREVKEQLNPQ